jgi:disulfide bond formation protein DsbB
MVRQTLALPAIALATLGSALLLVGAYGFEWIGNMPPCELCWWQRYPHFAVVGFGVLALAWASGRRALGWLAVLTLLVGVGIAAFHVGVEWKWWPGPGACTAPLPVGLTMEDMMRQIIARPVIRCDEPAWSLLGISMAGYNGLVSLALAGLVGWRLTRKDRP